MAWEQRNNRRYYYRCWRVAGGRVIKTYCGAGFIGGLAADLDHMKRADRSHAVQRRRSLFANLQGLAEPLVELCNVCDAAAGAALLAAGYHHRKGEWRKRHGWQKRAGTRTEN